MKIDEIAAFISVDEEGQEGIVSMNINGNWIPFVCADNDRIESLRPHAIRISKESNKQIKLIKFINRYELETLKPV